MANATGSVASNVLGTIGTICLCIQLIPQIWYNWRRKSTEGLPAMMFFLWGSCAVPMGAYLVLQDVNIPMQIQPQIFGFLSLVCWGQVLYYGHQYSRLRAFLTCAGTTALLGGIEALLILTLKIPYNQGITWPDILVGVLAAILISAGLVPPYFELKKRNGRVIGINWIFLGTDFLGGLFSLVALATEGSFDIVGGIMYICVIVLESGIFISHIVWRIRYRALIKESKASGKSIDELLESTNGSHSTLPDPEKDAVSVSPTVLDKEKD